MNSLLPRRYPSRQRELFRYFNGFYYITDRKSSERSRSTVYEDCKLVLGLGVNIIQYREKDLEGVTRDAAVKLARELRELCHQYGALLIVNDYVDIAREVDADGVHVGQKDLGTSRLSTEKSKKLAELRRQLGRDKIIGVSCSTLDEAISARSLGANYLGIGSIFHTQSKPEYRIVGIEGLRGIRQLVELPIVALGGITLENVECVLPLCDSVAMISGAYQNGGLVPTLEHFWRTYKTIKGIMK